MSATNRRFFVLFSWLFFGLLSFFWGAALWASSQGGEGKAEAREVATREAATREAAQAEAKTPARQDTGGGAEGGDASGKSRDHKGNGGADEKAPARSPRPADPSAGTKADPAADADAPPPGPAPRETPEEMTPTALKEKLNHKHQVGLEVGFGWGYRLIKPYGDVWCGERDDGDNAAFCMAPAPAFMELGLSFGVMRSMDLVVDFRYGLQKDDISDRNPMALMAGVRFWLNPNDSFKWALGLQVVLDFTKQDGEKQKIADYKAPDRDSFDIGGRFYGQIQYDFFRYLGLYIKLSGVVGALRWLRMEMEVMGGVQARFP